jgi:hypothetical protein
LTTVVFVIVSCPTCGPLELPANAAAVDAATRVFRFVCPSCGTACTRRADDDNLAFMLRAGAAVKLPG